MSAPVSEQIFDAVVSDPDKKGGLENKALDAEPGNFIRHVLSLSATKVADGLISPKLVLSWLLTSLGAGAFWTGLLVPTRESLALLPQIFTAPRIASRPVRKWFWAGGSLVQGAAALGIGIVAFTLEGAAAGAAVVALLAILALARSVCSASYKDILGKTVGKSRRGTATGIAGSVSSIGVLIFAILLMTGWIDRLPLVEGAILLAAALWFLGGTLFLTLKEFPSETDDTPGTGAQFGLLREEPQLRLFILARALLVGTALAPPFLVMLQPDGALGALGALVLASALASLLSSFVWGRLSDRSSRRVLIYSGIAGALALLAVAAVAVLDLAETPFLIPTLLFALMIAYQGVRQGRSTHLVDMAGEERRAAFTALSNTIVGLVLIGAGAVSAGIGAISVPLVITLFAVMCCAGAVVSARLEEVQQT